MATDIYLHVGKRIREERHNKAWTLEQLATAADISTGFLAYIERGKRKPSLATVKSLCDALQIPTAALFQEAVAGRSSDDKTISKMIQIARTASPVKRKMMLRLIQSVAR